MRKKIIGIILVSLTGILLAAAGARADTIYLKNGRSIEGFVVEEKPESILVYVGFGNVGFKRSEIESISRSSEENSKELLDKWVRQKQKSEERRKEEIIKEAAAPKNANIVNDLGQIVVEALLNKKVKADLILDTGATLVVLKDSVARQLGIDTGSLTRGIKLKLADGNESVAKYVILPSISVQGAEAVNVEVAILPDGVQEPFIKDGLLGMSYLRNFSFKIDQRNKKLVLERL
jgi:clan AA aspartic protease (TIGR02281 family)